MTLYLLGGIPVLQCLSPPPCKWSHERVWDPAQEAGTRKVGAAMIYYMFFFASGSPLNSFGSLTLAPSSYLASYGNEADVITLCLDKSAGPCKPQRTEEQVPLQKFRFYNFYENRQKRDTPLYPHGGYLCISMNQRICT